MMIGDLLIISRQKQEMIVVVEKDSSSLSS